MTVLSSLDFTALKGLEGAQYRKRRNLTYGFFVVPFLVYLLIDVVANFSDNIATILFLGCYTVGFFIYAVLYFLAWTDREAAFKKFSDTNNLKFSGTGPPKEKGAIFKIGQRRKKSNIVEMSADGLPIERFDYQFSYGVNPEASKDTSIDISFYVIKVCLQKSLPHMFINCLVEEGRVNSSVLPISFDKKFKVELEGDFYKYFSLYVQEPDAIEALKIFAPDVMDDLMRMRCFCDIEIVDDRIYFYSQKISLLDSTYRDMFITAEEVAKGIINNMRKHQAASLGGGNDNKGDVTLTMMSPKKTKLHLKRFWPLYLSLSMMPVAALAAVFYIDIDLVILVLVFVAIGYLYFRNFTKQYLLRRKLHQRYAKYDKLAAINTQ